ncbi:hypothetical protein V5H42_25565, partial [Salmonella enterica]
LILSGWANPSHMFDCAPASLFYPGNAIARRRALACRGCPMGETAAARKNGKFITQGRQTARLF